MDRKEAEEFNKDLTGNIGGGIGAEIGSRGSKPTVLRALDGSPAQKAGLQAGDVIVAVNDESASGWSVSDTVNKIRGDIGTTVKVTVLRGTESKDFTITREQITSPSVDSTVVDGIGIMTMRRFDDTTTDLARKAAQDFKNQNVKGVILDLRGNGGGLLTAAQDVSGLWLRDKVVVSERTNGKVTDELRSGGNPVLEGVPTVVLTNGGSASASEIVAGALQDNGAAILIGEKTFGKGSVQKLIDLQDGSVLKVTVARWYTPNGKNINKEGISPDKKVELTADDANAGRDPQMDAAKAYLKK
jgi:carboxyl-terminal processing protease